MSNVSKIFRNENFDLEGKYEYTIKGYAFTLRSKLWNYVFKSCVFPAPTRYSSDINARTVNLAHYPQSPC